jgi:coenzyme F420-dependent glucose-6-phosphate dehydrogenase
VKFGWLSSHESNQPEDLVVQAVEAERVGFDAVFASDHFHPWVDDTGAAAGFVWSWLGTVAARTERVELATLVTAPLFHYHPGLVAQAAATLDRLSGGRFRLGVGTGEAINETSLGYEFPSYRERADRLAEAIDIIRRLLAGEKVTHDGRYYRLDRARLYSPPLHGVPIWMAAGGPQSAELAGRQADGVIVSVKEPQDAIDKVIDPFHAAGGSGRTIVATRWAVYAVDREEAWQALRPMRGLRAPGRLEAVDPMDLRIRADDMPREEILSKYPFALDADDLFEVYRPLVESVGADYVSIQVACVDPIESIRLIGREVLPRLREIKPKPIQESAAVAQASRG